MIYFNFLYFQYLWDLSLTRCFYNIYLEYLASQGYSLRYLSVYGLNGIIH
ncbi:hypothetical protein ENTCAN_07359 [Enterobacter cancerogenus ATCC 35316]|nr:hypothetical protein ENTCAN_07359 [Enterobacter cancerogenus ATCC 35316]